MGMITEKENIMGKILKLKKYWHVYRIALKVTCYEKRNLAVQMLYWNRKYKCWLPWESLTVNLDGKREKNYAFIDTNYNGEEILPWIVRYRLAVPTGRTRQYGLCTYPEYRFREEALRRFDKKGYERYLMELEKCRARNGKKDKKKSA